MKTLHDSLESAQRAWQSLWRGWEGAREGWKGQDRERFERQYMGAIRTTSTEYIARLRRVSDAVDQILRDLP